MAILGNLLDRYDRELRKAFIAAIRDITSQAQLDQIIKALEQGNLQEAVDAVYLDPAAFESFERTLQAAYLDGGGATINALPNIYDANGQFIVRFNARNERAERWLQSYSSQFVTMIVDEQQENIRKVLKEGMEKGRNPRSVGLDITGRYNRITKRREGGIVGLAANQERAVARARQELETGDYYEYLNREKRDKRFDRSVNKALKDGKPLTQTQINKMINRYSDGLLKLRGQTIGRTEALASLHAAQYDALQQLVKTGKVKANQIRRVWDATKDLRTRRSHAIVDGQSVGLDEYFIMPSGAKLRYPGDSKGGAAEVINCRCFVTVRIDFLSNVASAKKRRKLVFGDS